MEITKWTQNEINNDFHKCNTLGELIGSLEAHFVMKGQVVCEISVDGMSLSEEQEHVYKSNSVDNISEIIVKSSTHEALFLDSLDSLCIILSEVEQEFVECADFFRLMDLQRAQKIFDGTIQKSQLALDLNRYFAQASEQYLTPEFSGFSSAQWDTLQKRFLELSYQIYDAFQKKDYILLSDLLEYEFSNLLQAWKTWVLEIKNHFQIK